MLKVLGNRVLAKKIKHELVPNKTGILIPDDPTKRDCYVTIIDIGPDVSDKLRNGDVILIDRFSGKDLDIDGIDYVIINEDQIIAVEIKDQSVDLNKLI